MTAKSIVPTILMAVTGLFLSLSVARADTISFTIGLRGQAVGISPSPFINFEVTPVDSNGDTWFETVLRINLRDPSLSNPYNFAQFRVSYDGNPYGLSVNIGDSRTNNGGSGDSGTQSNDAEMQIGTVVSAPFAFSRLEAFGNDSNPAALATVVGLAGIGRDVILDVGNEYLSWDNGLGTAGSVSSPYLYALNGQTDSEGPVNYNIYASFNRVIDGNYRIGSGVGEVTVTLSSSPFPVPEPGTLSMLLIGFGLLGLRWIFRVSDAAGRK
jgi:hypothetical protein